MEQSAVFQQGFFGLVFYDEHGKDTPALRWNKLDNCSVRLMNILTHGQIYENTHFVEKEVQSIEKLSRKEFMKIRNAGKKTWDEFVKLRGY